jgi:hypothetical protein
MPRSSRVVAGQGDNSNLMKRQFKPRTWGFQLSPTDAAAIGGILIAALVLRWLDSPLWWMLMIVAGHFFLFCNVFRIIRRRELIWAGLFLLNSGFWIWFDRLTWLPVLLCQLPVTVALVAAEMRAPGYHGVWAKRINPRLNDYLERRV